MKDFTRLHVRAERSSWGVVIRPNIWSGFCFLVSSLFCNDAANAADAARQSAAIHKAPSHLAVPGTGYAVEEIPVPRGIAPEIGGWDLPRLENWLSSLAVRASCLRHPQLIRQSLTGRFFVTSRFTTLTGFM